MGFTPDLVAGVYVGFDEHRTLGRHAYGSNTAGPIWKAFMEKALEGRPGIPFRTPPGIHLVRTELETGRRAGPGSQNVILEAYKEGQGPRPRRAPLPSRQEALGVSPSASSQAPATAAEPEEDGATAEVPADGGATPSPGSSGLY